jgi:hypothetical protein
MDLVLIGFFELAQAHDPGLSLLRFLPVERQPNGPCQQQHPQNYASQNKIVPHAFSSLPLEILDCDQNPCDNKQGRADDATDHVSLL